MITCPVCAHAFEPLIVIAHLTICPACFMTLAIDAETARYATAKDTEGLSPADLTAARQARHALRSAK